LLAFELVVVPKVLVFGEDVVDHNLLQLPAKQSRARLGVELVEHVRND
jgi:hypothetical protein